MRYDVSGIHLAHSLIAMTEKRKITPEISLRNPAAEARQRSERQGRVNARWLYTSGDTSKNLGGACRAGCKAGASWLLLLAPP
jgi:hypothetical protein